MEELNVPALVGEKVTSNVSVPPGGITAGKEGTLLKVKGAPGSDISETVKLPVPRLRMVTKTGGLLLPIGTSPKSMFGGAN